MQIVDVSLREQAACNGSSLSFKEKIEVARQLDKLNVDAIETAPIVNGKNDIVFLHTLAPLMTRCILACPVGLDPELLPDTWEALRAAKHPRLNVVAPVSTVQMEYQFHKKPPVVLDMIRAQVKACRKGFGIVNKAEIDVFLELSCFFDDPGDVGNLIFDFSVFSKSSLNVWKFSAHVL